MNNDYLTVEPVMYQTTDWEARRYEIAKDVLTALAAKDNANRIGKTLLCRTAVSYADVLIKTLRDCEPVVVSKKENTTTLSKMENVGKDFNGTKGCKL